MRASANHEVPVRRALSRLIVVLGMSVLVLFPYPPAGAQVDTSNDHTSKGIWHGWTRRWHSFDSSYHFHGLTDHCCHGQKYVSVSHFDVSHQHCNASGNPANGHVDCNAHVKSWKHHSYHQAPSPPQADCVYNDGHGICDHIMEPLAP